jgi:hypothetical protein
MTDAVTVADIMQSAVRTVARDTSASELVAVLAAAKVTGLPVVDARERVMGVSSTDLIAAQAGMRCAAEREILMEQTPVRDIMTPKPLMISPAPSSTRRPATCFTQKCVDCLSRSMGCLWGSSHTLTSYARSQPGSSPESCCFMGPRGRRQMVQRECLGTGIGDPADLGRGKFVTCEG